MLLLLALFSEQYYVNPVPDVRLAWTNTEQQKVTRATSGHCVIFHAPVYFRKSLTGSLQPGSKGTSGKEPVLDEPAIIVSYGQEVLACSY